MKCDLSFAIVTSSHCKCLAAETSAWDVQLTGFPRYTETSATPTIIRTAPAILGHKTCRLTKPTMPKESRHIAVISCAVTATPDTVPLPSC